METFDELWRGGPRFCQTESCFKLSTDSVLLADFTNTKRARNCLDLGSGAGVLSILIAFKNSEIKIKGIEIQPEFAELSRKNLSANGLENRAEIINADLRECRKIIPAESVDLVVSNPPYFAENSGYSAPAGHRALSREEKSC
ncbi:MAG: methyltransferase, partial [Clostridiales bacterium]|nr:methyltransferase [Clostridiales bacterium]